MDENKIYKSSYLTLVPKVLMFGIFLPLLLISSFFSVFGALMMILVIILFGSILIYAYLSIKMASYELKSDGLFIKRGIIAKKQILLLYSQIQDVSEYQDLFAMIFSLKSLQIQTMTSTSSAAGVLPYIKAEDADELRKAILKVVHSKSKKSAKSAAEESKTSGFDADKEQDEKAANPYPLHFVKMGVALLVIFLTIIVIGAIVIMQFKSNYEALINIGIYAMFLLFIPIGYFIQQISFNYWISDNTVTIKSGLFNTQKTTIEYKKVQDFILSQSILDRILGLGSVRLETGSVVAIQTNNNKQVPNYMIPALEEEDSRKIGGMLMSKLGITYQHSSNPLVKQIPLSINKVMKKTLAGVIGLLIFFGIIFSVLWVLLVMKYTSNVLFTYGAIAIAVLFIFFAVCTLIYQKMYYDRYFYDISKDTLTIKKGVIGKNQIFLPFDKIQNVFMDQDLLDRAFGLYDVHVSTVGFGSIAMCHIDGLEKEEAEKMLEVLLKKVKENS